MARRVAAIALRDGSSTRDLILDAAERRFAERGFSGVSVREIAADAGLKNQASLYNHFRNKRALYESTLARGLEPIATLVAARDQERASETVDFPRERPSRRRQKKAAPQGERKSHCESESNDSQTVRAEALEARSSDLSTLSSVGLERQSLEVFLDRVLDYLEQHPHVPRLIQRAGLDDSRYLRNAATRLLRPLYAQGMRVLEGTSAPWEPAQLPQLAAGLYHLIFGYFANAGLLQAVVQGDPLSPVAVARQRRFLKTAVAQLLGVSAAPRNKRPNRSNGKEAAI